MVRKNTLKTNIKNIFSLIAAFICIGSTLVVGSSVHAEAVCTTTNGIKTCTCNGSPCEADSNFQVNVTEILTVALTPVKASAGNAGEFIRNSLTMAITSNNGGGFTTSMNTKTANNSLTNTTDGTQISIVPSGSTYIRGASGQPDTYWGYSTDDSGDANGSHYYFIPPNDGVQTPVAISSLSNNRPDTVTGTLYFGAQGSNSMASGTYANTVVFNVVGGVINDNPGDNIPDNPNVPAKPDDTIAVNPSYNSGTTANGTSYGYTTYTSSDTSGGQTTTTTTVTKGDTRTSYAGPQGVVSSFLGFCEESPLAAGLIIAAVAAALAGLVFFVIAKRKKDKEDDNQSEY